MPSQYILAPSSELLSAIRDRISYDPATGQLRYKKTWRGRLLSLRDRDGYIRFGFRLGDKRYYLRGHVVAWFLHYDVWPNTILDHRDGDGGNNKIDNLRPSSPFLNACNRKLISRNTSGVAGVNWDKREEKFIARISHYSVRFNLGEYELFEDACAARRFAESVLHGEYAGSLRHGIAVQMPASFKPRGRAAKELFAQYGASAA